MKTVSSKTKTAQSKIRCPHGYKATNLITWASNKCWNTECHANG